MKIALGGSSLTPRDRRTLLVGGSAVAAILLFGKAVPAAARWQSARVAAAVDMREQLQAARSASGGLAGIRDSARARTSRLDTVRRRLLRAPSPEGAASALASLVESAAAAKGVDVQTVALKPDTVVRAQLARVQVRLNAEGDVRGLTDLLHSLETHAVPVAVREIVLTQSDALAVPARMETLRFDVVLETIARINPPASRRGGSAP